MTVPRVVVVGNPAQIADLRRALPHVDWVAADNPLTGVYEAGAARADATLMPLQTGRSLSRALRSLREVSPRCRIVLTCRPEQEPHARQYVQEGADDYLVEPLSTDELRIALGLHSDEPAAVAEIRTEGGASAIVSPSGPTPILRDPARLLANVAELLGRLDRPPHEVLAALAELARDWTGAAGAALASNDADAAVGDFESPTELAVLTHDNEPVGELTLAFRPDAAQDRAALEALRPILAAALAAQRAFERCRTLAYTDELSGLHNRRHFDPALDELIARAARERTRITLILFDIDHFKTYNDRYGHEVGDELIRQVAQLLTRCCREHDLIARFGGDEFAVALWDAEKPRVPGSQHPHDPMTMAERFRKAIGEHQFSCIGPDAPGPVTISGGLACYPWDGGARAALLAAADAALLTAKRTGKNRIELAADSNGGSAA